jgi:hypothetical protein
MMNNDPITPESARALDRLGNAEIVVGVVTLNSERTIRQVVGAVVSGLAHAFPGRRAALVIADAGSRDATVEAARAAAPGAAVVVARPAEHGPGSAAAAARPSGSCGALEVLCAAVERLGADGCAVLDGDERTVAPDWIRLLLEPVLGGGLDLVAPVYARHRYAGLLTTSLVYPLTRALYGRRLRQPVGCHFGFSAAFVRRLRAAGGWDAGPAPYRRDLWITTTALAGALPVGQAHLVPDTSGHRRFGVDLGQTFMQVVGTVFRLMEQHRRAWWAVVETSDVPTFGTPRPAGREPVSVNVDRMVSTFRQGVADLMPLWRRALAPETCRALKRLDDRAGAFRFPPALWARVVYDGAVAAHLDLLPRAQLLRALIPLYLGRAAALVLATAEADAPSVEMETDTLCSAFESSKPYLLDRWDARRT